MTQSFKKIFFFIYLIHERHTHTQRQRHRQREKQALRREPDVELDPGTPGLCPGPKAGIKPLSHPGKPPYTLFVELCCEQAFGFLSDVFSTSVARSMVFLISI